VVPWFHFNHLKRAHQFCVVENPFYLKKSTAFTSTSVIILKICTTYFKAKGNSVLLAMPCLQIGTLDAHAPHERYLIPHK
jgi:hypothetical protein